MSSRYNWVCLTHDPAIEIERPEYQKFDEITGAILNRNKPEDHTKCDLIVGRWSGGMVEAVCPECQYHSTRYQKWVGLDWLRLLYRVWSFNTPTLGGHVHPQLGISIPNSLTQCWHFDRLDKLFSMLGERIIRARGQAHVVVGGGASGGYASNITATTSSVTSGDK